MPNWMSKPAALWIAVVVLVILLFKSHREQQDMAKRIAMFGSALLNSDRRDRDQSGELSDRLAVVESRLEGTGEPIASTGFLLKDEGGTSIASFGLDETGPMIKLFTRAGTTAAEFSTGPDGSGRILLKNANGTESVMLNSSQDAGGQVSVIDRVGTERIRIAAADQFDAASVVILDDASRETTRIDVDGRGSGRFLAMDPALKGRVEIGIDEERNGVLSTLNRDGGKLVTLTGTPNGGVITSHGSNDAPKVVIDVSSSGSGRMATRDPDGNTLVGVDSTGFAGTITIVAGTIPCVALGADEQRKGFIETLDADGRSLVRMGASDDGHGLVSAFQAAGYGKSSIGVNAGGDGFASTFSSTGTPLAAFGVGDDGYGMIKAFNQNGDDTVTLGAQNSGDGFVSTFSADGRRLVQIGSVRGGFGSLTSFGPDGEKRFGLSAGGVQILAAAGKLIASLGSDTAGNGILHVAGGSDRSEVRVITGPAGGGIIPFDPEGRPMKDAPLVPSAFAQPQ